MNAFEISVLAVAASIPVAMIVGNHVRRCRHTTTTRVKKPADADAHAINKGICPDCQAHGTLLAGPSDGMSQNIACNSCLMEFNVGFGFGTGAFMVDRTGLMSENRARVFGIHPNEYRAITAKMAGEA